MLLHHSQTRVYSCRFAANVWYLMLLHHSQTSIRRLRVTLVSGILCFYIILKHRHVSFFSFTCLVSYAFTSFSNGGGWLRGCRMVWYLMLLHHSQTNGLKPDLWNLVWYLMLLHHSQTPYVV